MATTSSIKNLPASEVEIIASIPVDEFMAHREAAIESLRKEATMDGFRKGAVPADLLIKKIGEDVILHEMAEIAIGEAYPALLAEHTLDAIGRPHVSITKIASGNPLEFTIITAVFPKIALPDYKKIAGEVPASEGDMSVSDEEVTKVIDEIRTNFAHQMAHMGHDHGAMSDEEKAAHAAEKPELPELDDAFAQKLGTFATVADLRAKLTENLGEEKAAKAAEKRRLTIIEKVAAEVQVEIPRLLAESELDRMMAQFKDNVAMMGQTPEGYFAQIKKSEEEVREGWLGDAEKRVKIQLILEAVARAEKLTVPEEKLVAEVDEIIKRYPGATEERARAYAENRMINDMVFALLEGGR